MGSDEEWNDLAQGLEPILPIKISIHDPFSVADLRTSAVTLKNGFETTFFITPTKVDSSSNLKEVPVDKRNCWFEDEAVKLFLFRYAIFI